ncbi:DeoR family transcriptional regulator [Lysinibacillus sp. NPDC056185]|uniref:DeoR family transcriptional regulator n=1 Tax=Lysinibacillus sp. NPDC056185 TaxID=3345739 RepID=UPI0039EF218A
MYTIERQQHILQFVRKHIIVKLVTLTKEFNVSTETIRRDIQHSLCKIRKWRSFMAVVNYPPFIT